MTHLYLNVSLFSMRNFYLFIYFLILCYRRLVAWLGSFSHGHTHEHLYLTRGFQNFLPLFLNCTWSKRT